MVSVGDFMTLLDSTVIAVAIPNVIRGMAATVDQALWVLDAYILVFAVALIPAARLGEILGQRAVFAVGLALVAASSAACGLSQDAGQLIAGRVAQGLGAALLTPKALAIISATFPAEKSGGAFCVWGAVQGLAAVAGPTLGGVIITDADWRWIFFVNLPVGTVALVALFLAVPAVKVGKISSLDPIDIVIAAAGLFCVNFGLIEGQCFDSAAVAGPLTIPELIGVGAVVLAGFVAWEWWRREPLVPLSMFASRNFSLVNAAGIAVSFGVGSFYVVFYLYARTVLGMSALRAGLTIVAFSLTSLLVAPVAGRLHDRVRGGAILVLALLCHALGLGMVAWSATASATWASFQPGFILPGHGAPTPTGRPRGAGQRNCGRHASHARPHRGVIAAAGLACLAVRRRRSLARDSIASAPHDAPPTSTADASPVGVSSPVSGSALFGPAGRATSADGTAAPSAAGSRL
jgi:EmrB/QacA subfamily drug resistance transporter